MRALSSQHPTVSTTRDSAIVLFTNFKDSPGKTKDSDCPYHKFGFKSFTCMSCTCGRVNERYRLSHKEAEALTANLNRIKYDWGRLVRRGGGKKSWRGKGNDKDCLRVWGDARAMNSGIYEHGNIFMFLDLPSCQMTDLRESSSLSPRQINVIYLCRRCERWQASQNSLRNLLRREICHWLLVASLHSHSHCLCLPFRFRCFFYRLTSAR